MFKFDLSMLSDSMPVIISFLSLVVSYRVLQVMFDRTGNSLSLDKKDDLDFERGIFTSTREDIILNLESIHNTSHLDLPNMSDSEINDYVETHLRHRDMKLVGHIGEGSDRYTDYDMSYNQYGR